MRSLLIVLPKHFLRINYRHFWSSLYTKNLEDIISRFALLGYNDKNQLLGVFRLML